jgi:hypothetical protein
MPTPCTVSGNLQTLTSGQIAQGRVIFQLTNTGTGNPIGVSGTSIFPALVYSVMTGPDGSFSVSLWGNDNITPANTLYAVTYRDPQGNELGPILYSIVGSAANLNTLTAISTTLPPVFMVSGSLTLAISNQSTNFTVANFATLYRVTTAASTITVTLPTAIGFPGQLFIVKKIDSGVGTAILTPVGGQTIDGLASFTLSAQGQFMTLISNGSSWDVWARN